MNGSVASEFLPASEMFIRQVIESREDDSDVERRLRVLITSAGNPKPWSVVKRHSFIWIHVVSSVYHARKAEQSGVDIIVASGHEDGARVSWEPVHSVVLLPAVVRAVGCPMVAAGGFCDGVSLAAALCLGAVGVQMVTRFIATQESDFEDVWKGAIIEREERQTLTGRGIFGTMRFLRNRRAEKIVEQTLKDIPEFYLGRPVPSSERILSLEREGFDCLLDGDSDNALMFGGECMGRISDLPTVNELIERMIEEAQQVLRRTYESYCM